MDEALALTVLDRAHTSKRAYGSLHAANAAASSLHQAQGVQTSPYRCSFSSITGGAHFHIGHVPSMESVETMAEAIHWFAQHSESVPPLDPAVVSVVQHRPTRKSGGRRR